ncbi:MAG: transcriptional regulator [Actinomycetota bacterium]|nr:transcriptional regulator [Actinomycetota bacterium]
MELIRIGEKIISRDRLLKLVSEILHRRSRGATQQEVASVLGVERSFVSHLEGLGEIRRGKRIALIGLSAENRTQIEEIAREYAVDFISLPGEDYFTSPGRDPVELFNQVLEILTKLKEFDLVILLTPDKGLSLLEKVLDKEVVSIPLCKPGGGYLNPQELKSSLSKLIVKGKGGKWRERGRKYKSWILKKRPRSGS